MLATIREFCLSGAKGVFSNFKGLFDVFPTSVISIAKDIEHICMAVDSIVASEPQIVDIPSPVYAIGDIHGNLEDLMTLEKSLWPTVPFMAGPNLLFLGDYVDRGRWGFECTIYLFCLKILAPSKVTLLRGNHEVRHIQRQYSYHSEVLHKYGRYFGSLFFERTNHAFEQLPCAAIVDRRIFCSHGGIPFTGIGKPVHELIKNVPKGVKDPESVEAASLIWDLMWSDPVENHVMREEFKFFTDFFTFDKSMGASSTDTPPRTSSITDLTVLKQYEVGFLPNRSRGCAYLFNEFAFETFCTVNLFTHMIRAHQVSMEGYRFNFHHRVVTVFSCSHYCGIDNQSAVVQVADGRMRVIQLNTSKNQSATSKT